MEFLWAVLLLAATTLVGFAIKSLSSRKTSPKESHLEPLLNLIGVSDRDRLVMFSTTFCSRCPGLRKQLLKLESDSLVFLEVDLTENIALAKALNINQTPTTFLVSSSGELLKRFGSRSSRSDFESAIAERSNYAGHTN